MEQLLEILRRAASEPDATASDPAVQGAVSELLLDPVEKLVLDAGLNSASPSE